MNEKLTPLVSRKFILSVLIVIGFFVLSFFDKVTNEQLMAGLTIALGIYAASNVTQKVMTK